MVVVMVAFRLVVMFGLVVVFVIVFTVVILVPVVVVVVVVVCLVVMIVVIVVSHDLDSGAGVDHDDTLVRGHGRLADVVIEARSVLEQQERLADAGNLQKIVRGQRVVVRASGVRRSQQQRIPSGPVHNLAGEEPDRVCGGGDFAAGQLFRCLHGGADLSREEIQHAAERNEDKQECDGEILHMKTPFCLPACFENTGDLLLYTKMKKKQAAWSFSVSV